MRTLRGMIAMRSRRTFFLEAALLSHRAQMSASDAIPLTYLWLNTGESGQSSFSFTVSIGAAVTGGDGYTVSSCSAATWFARLYVFGEKVLDVKMKNAAIEGSIVEKLILRPDNNGTQACR